MVAFDTVSRRGVAITWYEQMGEGVAVCTVLQDGLAARRPGDLLILLLASGAERGLHTFSASYLADNRPIAALVQDARASWARRSSSREPPSSHSHWTGRNRPQARLRGPQEDVLGRATMLHAARRPATSGACPPVWHEPLGSR